MMSLNWYSTRGVFMAEKSTFIKIDRNITDWRWFRNPRILSVFLWLLIKANIKDGHFEKDTIKRGSLATSNASIADGCGLTIQNVRTALADLEETGEIKRIQRNHYQIVEIINYELYQSDSRKSIGQLTGNSQATNRQLTTIKEYKNKRIKEKPPISPQGGTTPNGEIPEMYRDQFETYDEYMAWRNQ